MFCLRRYVVNPPKIPITSPSSASFKPERKGVEAGEPADIATSWLPLLFIPTNASPAFILMFFISTYFLNRPCVYCSVLLLILFISSCYWSDQCFFDLHSNWFEPRHLSSPLPNPISNPFNGSYSAGFSPSPAMESSNVTMWDEASFLAVAVNNTATALAGAAIEEVKRRVDLKSEWTGIGVEWIRSLLGRREWKLPCVDVLVRL
ncbi:MAG: hypothetical protein M1837_007440 [Sclerophora amabilis]|nr:MAG: hypothetical protein M1837_007440 [Sclerophora amabilis]